MPRPASASASSAAAAPRVGHVAVGLDADQVAAHRHPSGRSTTAATYATPGRGLMNDRVDHSIPRAGDRDLREGARGRRAGAGPPRTHVERAAGPTALADQVRFTPVRRVSSTSCRALS